MGWDLATFAEAVRTRRAAERKTLRELAEELEINVSTLSRVETCQGSPNIETFVRLDGWLRGESWSVVTRCSACAGTGVAARQGI